MGVTNAAPDRWDVEIRPFSGIGPVTFGMTKRDVRTVLGPPEKEFVRNPEFAPDYVEWIYDDGRAFVTFDGTGACVEILLCPPADPRLMRVQLLGIAAADAWRELQRLDALAFVDESGGCLTSKLYGVSVYAPEMGTEFEEPGDPAWSVLVLSDAEDERLTPAGFRVMPQ
jgi:hypothetical protein